MKKTVLISALALLWSFEGFAADRDCAVYTMKQAGEATSDLAGNTVEIIFSGKTSRRGTTNVDCGQASDGANHVISSGDTDDDIDDTGGSTGGDYHHGAPAPTPH